MRLIPIREEAVSLSKTRNDFAVMMQGAAAAARTYKGRMNQQLTAALADYQAGTDLNVAQLVDLVTEITARAGTRTRENGAKLMQANHRLMGDREAWQKASSELRTALRDLKHIMEAAYGKTRARLFLNLPPALPPESLLLETAAASAVAALEDQDRPLPAHGQGLLLDRAYWARTLGEKLERARQTRSHLMEMRKLMTQYRADRNSEHEQLDRHGRAAWLILKGLLMFSDERLLVADLNNMRRPRRRQISETPPRAEALEPVSEEAIEEEQHRIEATPPAGESQRIRAGGETGHGEVVREDPPAQKPERQPRPLEGTAMPSARRIGHGKAERGPQLAAGSEVIGSDTG